jgi:Cytochrome P460
MRIETDGLISGWNFVTPIKRGAAMKGKSILVGVGISMAAIVLATGVAISAQDKYTLSVPNGLAFSEFRGYEGWQVVSISHGSLLAVIVGNPVMIDAYKAGIPGNGKPFPDGAKMAKIHWNPIKNESVPGQPMVPSTLHDVDFMVKDSKRFAESGGWGYAEFEYDTASGTFRPGTQQDQPPQANDAKCGAACHTIVQKQDYVFTGYPKR